MCNGEKRKHPRLSIRHTGVRNGFLVGRVLNMSLGGLALESTTALTIGSSQTFRVAIGEHAVKVAGEIRWCRLTHTVGKGKGEVVAIFRAGFSFSRPLALFSEGGLQNSGGWFDPEFRVPR